MWEALVNGSKYRRCKLGSTQWNMFFDKQWPVFISWTPFCISHTLNNGATLIQPHLISFDLVQSIAFHCIIFHLISPSIKNNNCDRDKCVAAHIWERTVLHYWHCCSQYFSYFFILFVFFILISDKKHPFVARNWSLLTQVAKRYVQK